VRHIGWYQDQGSRAHDSFLIPNLEERLALGHVEALGTRVRMGAATAARFVAHETDDGKSEELAAGRVLWRQHTAAGAGHMPLRIRQHRDRLVYFRSLEDILHGNSPISVEQT